MRFSYSLILSFVPLLLGGGVIAASTLFARSPARSTPSTDSTGGKQQVASPHSPSNRSPSASVSSPTEHANEPAEGAHPELEGDLSNGTGPSELRADDEPGFERVHEANLSILVPKDMVGTKVVKSFPDRDHIEFHDPSNPKVTFWVDVSKGFNDVPSWNHASDLDRRFAKAYKGNYRRIALTSVPEGTLWEFEQTTGERTLHKLDMVGKTAAGRDLAAMFAAEPGEFEPRRELALKLVRSVEDFEDPGEGRSPVK